MIKKILTILLIIGIMIMFTSYGFENEVYKFANNMNQKIAYFKE